MKLRYVANGHQYWLDGKRCKGASSVAGLIEDDYAIRAWQNRHVAIGMALKPELAERVIAHHDDRATMRTIVDEAIGIAGGNDKRDRGIAVHRNLERHDAGEIVLDSPGTVGLRAAYDQALKDAGLTVVPEYVERVIVHPEQRIAGRFDRIYRNKQGRYVIADIKTGESAIKYPHKTAIQLALYANAPHMAAPIPGHGGETETFEPLPDKLDRKVGYIIYVDDTNGVEIVPLEIAQAWETCKTIVFPALKWNKLEGLVRPSVATATAEAADQARRERLKERMRWFADNGHLDKVAEGWPNVPGLKGDHPHTYGELKLIEIHLNQVGMTIGEPF